MKPRPINTSLGAAPLLPICVAFVAGIVAVRVGAGLWMVSFMALAACTVALLRRPTIACWIGAAALGGADVLLQADNDLWMPAADLNGKEIYCRGQIMSTTINNASQGATVVITHAGADSSTMTRCRSMTVQVVVPAFEPELQPGYDIEFRGTLRRVEPMKDLPDERDPADRLMEKGITYSALCLPGDIYRYSPSEGLSVWLLRLRGELTLKLYSSGLGTEAKELVNAMLLGDQSDLTEVARSRFTEAGLGHVLALSGLHVGLIALLIAWALWPLRLLSTAAGAGIRASAAVTDIIVILLLWAYAALTGMAPSVTRAVVMATVYIGGRLLQRDTSALNTLCAAALIILLFDPAAVASAGFQLSFAAVLAIVLFVPLINRVSPRRRWFYALSSYAAMSVAAVAGTAVVAAMHFHMMPLYFLPANMVAALLLPLILGGSALLLLLECAGLDPLWLCTAINTLCDWLNTTADFFAGLPGSTITRIYLPAVGAVAWATLLASVYAWLTTRRRLAAVATGAGAIAFAATVIFSPPPQRLPHLYLARTKGHTEIIVDDMDRALHIVTTRPTEPLVVRERARMRYADYMGRRGIDSVNVINTPDYRGRYFWMEGDVVCFGDRTIAIVHGESLPQPSQHPQYALICRGYRGSIADVMEVLRPDSVVLGSDLNPRRRRRYERECRELGVGYVSPEAGPWGMAY